MDDEDMKVVIRVELESRKLTTRFAAGSFFHGRKPVDKRL
jgi:hypothetical protein